jgi:hypothetical protein
MPNFIAQYMELIMSYITLERVGLILNFVGTVMVAFAFGKTIEEAYQVNGKGVKVSLAAFRHPALFRWGIVLLCLGFALQVFA